MFMAILTSEFTFTGSIGNVSAYRVKGSNQIRLRRKGGASKKQIQEAPQFDITRRLNAEFGGRATACKRILHSLFPLKYLADYNMAGPLNALLKPIQEIDAENEFGKRSIRLSQNPQFLDGFSFNRIRRFETILTAPILSTMSKETGSAVVTVPAIVPGINFKSMAQYPICSFIAVLAAVPDLFWSTEGYVSSHFGYGDAGTASVASEWFSSTKGSMASRLLLSLPTMPANPSYSLILGIGVRFGLLDDLHIIKPVRFGSAKILTAI
jgi:hypothetical protein